MKISSRRKVSPVPKLRDLDSPFIPMSKEQGSSSSGRDNDSIETLLLRHYGHGPTPPLLEQRLVSSVGHQAVVRQQQERIAANIRTYRMNRRRAVQLVAIGSAGLGLFGAGLDILETALLGTDNTQSALP